MSEHTIPTDGQLDRVERALTVDDKDDSASVVATISQVYATTVDDLWSACTTAERLARWFSPVTGDLVVGGRYQVEGNASGVIEICQPPTSFRATWEFNGAVSWITVRIEPVDDGHARLSLEHSGDIPHDFWYNFGPGATGVGWELGFLGLAQHLATGSSKPVEATEWLQTDAAKEFIAGSSRRWADAWIAAGASEEAARGAEARTTAFYTGQDT